MIISPRGAVFGWPRGRIENKWLRGKVALSRRLEINIRERIFVNFGSSKDTRICSAIFWNSKSPRCRVDRGCERLSSEIDGQICKFKLREILCKYRIVCLEAFFNRASQQLYTISRIRSMNLYFNILYTKKENLWNINVYIVVLYEILIIM